MKNLRSWIHPSPKKASVLNLDAACIHNALACRHMTWILFALTSLSVIVWHQIQLPHLMLN